MYQEAVLGILVKLCDDIFDKSISVSPLIEETLKSLLVAFLVLVANGDFYFSSSILFFLLLNSKTDTLFWKALIPVTGMLALLNYTDQPLGLPFLYLIGGAAILYVEDRAFPEEVSKKKILFRVILFATLFITLASGYIKYLFPEYLVHTVTKGVVLTMFYIITSVCILTLKSIGR